VKICIVSKFPPIEGGIASRTYWQVRRLLEDGHEVTVVTNSGATEREYCIQGCQEHLRGLTERYQLHLHDVCGEAPWHIPSGPDHLERLLSVLLSVLSRNSFAVIESGYLVPYGIAAGLASKLTGIPHVVRHGGSDLAKFLPHPQYGELLTRILRQAEKVITDEPSEPLLRSSGAITELAPAYEPDPKIFAPRLTLRSGRVPVCAYIGKINYYWRRRGLDKMVEWYRANSTNVALRIVGQGAGRADFERWMAGQGLPSPVSVEPFVSPWQMPDLLAEVDSVCCLSVGDPITSDSMLKREAQAMKRVVVESLPAS
jgi:hypothetical protein